MMAASGGDGERSGLGKFVKTQTKYGTTTKSTYTNDTFFKYHFSKAETLQGIALKHGVTMEQIKRANNIWTNDSLCLREYLLIPIQKENSSNHQLLTNGSVPKTGAETNAATETHTSGALEIVTRQDLQAASKAAQCKTSKTAESEVSVDKPQPTRAKTGSTAQTAKPDKKDSVLDFLSRMDTSLAQIKNKVEELDQTSGFPQDMKNPLNHLPQKRSSMYGKRRDSRRSVDSDIVDPTIEPQLVFRSSHPDRQIQTSLEKLEQKQDDLFQL